jgi:hypothetical protein
VPNTEQRADLIQFLEDKYDVDFSVQNSPQNMAVDWLLEEDGEFAYDKRLAQRFALVALDFELLADSTTRTLPSLNWGTHNQDHCLWKGITCNSPSSVKELRFGGLGLSGTILRDISILKDVKYIDFSDNAISGSIPDELYSLTYLESLYLYKNQLTGTFSSNLGNLYSITHLHLSHNQLSGSIPSTIKKIYHLRKFFSV